MLFYTVAARDNTITVTIWNGEFSGEFFIYPPPDRARLAEMRFLSPYLDARARILKLLAVFGRTCLHCAFKYVFKCPFINLKKFDFFFFLHTLTTYI